LITAQSRLFEISTAHWEITRPSFVSSDKKSLLMWESSCLWFCVASGSNYWLSDAFYWRAIFVITLNKEANIGCW